MTRQHILIADDSPPILKLFKRLLVKGGYSVTAVASGGDALKVIEEQPIDLLVLDLNMPQPDGFELLRTLRKARPGLRVLVVSGACDSTVLKASKFLGATASLSKTAAPALLVKTVAHLLQ